MPVKITLCNNLDPKIYEDGCKKTAEDVIKEIAKELNIKPLCLMLYGLRNEKTLLWVCLSKKISEFQRNVSYQFRIRFRISSILLLKEIDYDTFTYVFYQTRHDFVKGYLPEYSKETQDGLGLVVTDLVHYFRSNPGKKISEIEWKSFLPSNLNTFAHRSNAKRRTEKLLESENFSEKCSSGGLSFIRQEYLQAVEDLGKEGRFVEKYDIEVDEGQHCYHTDLIIDPFHQEYPGLYHKSSKKVRKHVCRIEEIVFVSIRRQDLTVELSRANGIPYYYSVASSDLLESLVGALSGYYRLMKTWTFDLCRELPTPSLCYLKSEKCHGPVGKEFVLTKLKSRSNGQSGIGILRESSTDYDFYKLVVTQKSDNPPVELVITKTKSNQFSFYGSEESRNRLSKLIEWAIETNYRDCGLRRLIPPSEFDHASRLLLCASYKKMAPSKSSGPKIYNLGNFIVKNEAPLRGKFSEVYQCICPDEGNEEFAIKVPKFLKGRKDEFLSMMNKFLFVEGNCVVKIFGITLTPLTLVMEYLPLGPLHKYLKNNADKVRKVDLVEASSQLAKALCDLHSKGVTHHNIRCHNILVAAHTEQSFKIKLGDPGNVEYMIEDIHWIPREHIDHPPSALADSSVDTWAFGTTLWQIFSFGILPLDLCQMDEVKALYKEGQILGRPDNCPKDLYQIMTSCWHRDPHARRHPQSLVRDIQQIFYYVFNSRRENPYQKVNYTRIIKSDSIDADEFDEESLLLKDDDELSISTQVTTLTQEDGSLTQVSMSQIMNYPLIPNEIAIAGAVDTPYTHKSPVRNMKTLQELLVPPPWNAQEQDLVDTETQFELNNSTIDIVQRIGKGNYGYVFKGRMTFLDNRMEYVALKRLQSLGNSGDFKKEMDIMKNLRHENIVRFHGLIESDQEGSSFQYMVMEYLSLGSLQDYLLSNKDDKSLTSDKRLLAYSLDIAKGMDYLESKQIIHRDLATRNVLVESSDHVKITDFGLAQRPNQGNYYIIRTYRELPIKWYALESIEYGKYSHKSDVWSYGVTLWEMFTRGLVPDLPNDGCKLIQALKNGTRLMCKPPCQPFIYSKLIRPCWDQDPRSRPDFSKLIGTVSEIQDEI